MYVKWQNLHFGFLLWHIWKPKIHISYTDIEALLDMDLIGGISWAALPPSDDWSEARQENFQTTERFDHKMALLHLNQLSLHVAPGVDQTLFHQRFVVDIFRNISIFLYLSENFHPQESETNKGLPLSSTHTGAWQASTTAENKAGLDLVAEW